MSSKPFSISRLAIPTVCALIAFLAYTSQYFFLHFETSRLRTDEAWRINIFAVCIWICYYQSCFVDPGRIPKDWNPSEGKNSEADNDTGRQRWCRKCEAFKPPRAHHCRTCRRLVSRVAEAGGWI
jgi:palmitoyltransferase